MILPYRQQPQVESIVVEHGDSRIEVEDPSVGEIAAIALVGGLVLLGIYLAWRKR